MKLPKIESSKIRKLIINKYTIVLAIFFIWITFFGDHSLIVRYQTKSKINEMEKELEFYKEEIKSNKRKMNELNSNAENLEKFAREQYLMKREDEDIYIIKE
jgi:cell division protein DivIC